MQYAIQERIWLHLRDAGGWWTVDEVVRALWPQDPPQALNRALRQLAGANHIKAKVYGESVLAYAVTTKCIPFPGFSLEPNQL